MKRGLVKAAERDAAVYEARLDQLRRRLRDAGCDAALIYGDVYRSDDIAHLTNLCIYWNEGTIAVPVDGPPAFLAKLSARVHPWMRRTSIVDDLRASQRLPELISEYLSEIGATKVALVDGRWWPAQLAQGVRASTEGIEFVELPDAVRASRRVPDEVDTADLRVAAALAAKALAAAAGADPARASRLAAIERAARSAGARDVIATCGDEEPAQLDVTVQYGNVWARAARPLQVSDSLAAVFEKTVAELAPGVTVADLHDRLGGPSVDLIYHCDLATGGDYRAPGEQAEPVPDGAVLTLLVADGSRMLAETVRVGAGDTVVLTKTGPEVGA